MTVRRPATVTLTIRHGDRMVENEWDWEPPADLPDDAWVAMWLREQLLKAGFRDEWNAGRADRAGLLTPPTVERN